MTEHLAIEANGARLDEQRFPGRQGRILFAYLAAQGGRAVPRDVLAELLRDHGPETLDVLDLAQDDRVALD